MGDALDCRVRSRWAAKIFLAGMVLLFTAAGATLIWLAATAKPGELHNRFMVGLGGGLAILFLPGLVVFGLVRRRIKYGTFKRTEEERAAARAAVAKRRAPQTRKTRISMAVIWSFCAVLWTDVAMHGQHPGGLKWVTAAIYWVLAGMWIWRVFRPRKATDAEPAASLNLNQ